MLSKSYSNLDKAFALDVGYHVENLRDLLHQSNVHQQQIANALRSSEYSISVRKRNRLFRWVIEMLDKFNHDCPNPQECYQSCGLRCPGPCASRCHENCRKTRTISFKTRQLTFLLIDSVLLNISVKDTELQLLATSAFFLAAKLEESFLITAEDACYIGDDIYSPQELMAMEIVILKTLNWKLNYPTAGEISRKLLLALKYPTELNFEIFSKQIDDFIEFCILEYEINNYGAAAIALTSVMFTFEKMNMEVIGSEYVYTACQYFNLKAEDILECYKLLKAKIIEYYLSSQEITSNINSQLTVRDHNDDRSTCGISNEQKALMTADSMDIEKPQIQPTKVIKDKQTESCNGAKLAHCQSNDQEYPSIQNITTGNSANSLSTIELEVSNQNNLLACKETLF